MTSNYIYNIEQTVLSQIYSLPEYLPMELTNRIVSFVKSFFYAKEIANQDPQSGVIETLSDEDFKEYVSLMKLLPPNNTVLSTATTLEDYRQHFLEMYPVPATIPIQKAQESKKSLKQIEKDLERQMNISLDDCIISSKKQAEEKIQEIPKEKYKEYLDHLHQGIAYYLCKYLEDTFVNKDLKIFCAFTAYSIKISGDTQLLTISAEQPCELYYANDKGNKKALFEKGDLDHPGYLFHISLNGKIDIDFSVKDIQAHVSVEVIKEAL